MTLLLKKISLTDFLSHKDTVIEFSATENLLIDGASGAGKSSVFEGILWALYGEGRSDNRSLVRRGAKKATVRLELTQPRPVTPENTAPYDKDTIIIERTATTTGKHTLAAWTFKPENLEPTASPFTGVRELQTWIDTELIGASYLLFVNSVAYIQGNPESFVSQNAAKRKELLLEIVRAEDYQKHYENARQALSKLENDRNHVDGQIVTLEAQLGALKARLGNKMELAVTLSAETIRLKTLTPKREALEVEKAKHTAISQSATVLDNVYRTTASDAQKLEKSLTEKTERVSCKKHLIESLHGDARQSIIDDTKEVAAKIQELRGTIGSLSEQEAIRNEFMRTKPSPFDPTEEIEGIEQKIEKIESRPVCPSGVGCPYSGDHTKQVADLRIEIETIALAAEKEQKAFEVWATEAAKLPPPADLRGMMLEISTLESVIKSHDEKLAAMDKTQTEIDFLTEVEAELPALAIELQAKLEAVASTKKLKEDAELALDPIETNRIATELLSAQHEEHQAQEKITRTMAALENIEREENDAVALETRVSALRTEDLAVIQEKSRKVALIKDAFGAKGIETMVIDYLLPKLEDRINQVLGQLSEFRVRLDTQRKSADGESTVEGLFITILNEVNEELPFESYSGGERLKISVSISEALATLQKVGFRLFDETFLGLDENSTESFAEVLTSLQKSFPQVLCISHLIQIKELLDKKLVINKINSTSYVK